MLEFIVGNELTASAKRIQDLRGASKEISEYCLPPDGAESRMEILISIRDGVTFVGLINV